jgi:hypothetical protein
MMVLISIGKAVSKESGCEEARKAEADAMTTFRFGVERSIVLLKKSVLTSGANLKGEGSSSVYPALMKSQAAAIICSSKRKFDILKVRVKRSTAAS